MNILEDADAPLRAYFFFLRRQFCFYICRKCKHRFIAHLLDYIPDRIVIPRYCVHVIATRYGSVSPTGYTEFLTIQTPLKFADVRRLCDTMPLREIGCLAGFLSAAYNARDVFSQCYSPHQRAQCTQNHRITVR